VGVAKKYEKFVKYAIATSVEDWEHSTADRIDSFSASEAIALALPLIIPANCHDLKANFRRLWIVSIVAVATRSISAVVLVCPMPKRKAA
jgi:hypothetical protein